MPYFSNMPVFDYPIGKDSNGRVRFVGARNILVRAKIIDFVKETQSAFLDYTIMDGERPETLAHRVYGQSDLHWIILLFNETIDPLFEWPLSSQDLENAIARKYRGKAVFVNLKEAKFFRNGIAVTDSYREIWYEVGSTVTQENGAQGTVLSWDPNLYKVVIEQTGGVDFEVGSDLEQERDDGIRVVAPVGRVVDDNRYAVHHFENVDTGEVADHHRAIATSDGESSGESLIDRYATVQQDEINDGTGGILTRTADGDFVSVSNFGHEINLNDGRRNIKMMRPEFISIVIKDMRKIFLG